MMTESYTRTTLMKAMAGTSVAGMLERVFPGEIVREFDICEAVEGESGYRFFPVAKTMHGCRVREDDVVARIDCPEGYAPVGPPPDGESVDYEKARKEWLCWYQPSRTWEPLSNLKFAGDRSTHDEQWWLFAKPIEKEVKAMEEGFAQTMPANFRKLFPQERIRRGDRYFAGPEKGWQDVLESSVGSSVHDIAGLPPTGIIRAIHPNWRTWYLDTVLGDDVAGDGSPQRPFKTGSGAIRRIDNAYGLSDAPGPFGVLYNVDGTPNGLPVYVWDMPEPKEYAPAHSGEIARMLEEQKFDAEMQMAAQRELEQATEMEPAENTAPTVSAPDGFKLLKFREAIRPGDLWCPNYKNDTSPEWEHTIPAQHGLCVGSKCAPFARSARDVSVLKLEACAAHTGKTMSELVGAAVKSLPVGYRILSPGEEIRTGDKCYLPDHLFQYMGTLTWQEAPVELWGTEFRLVPDYLCARPVPPKV